jgi:predicted RNA binding protein YcfA (HicA-like mRNA interferase family)
VKARQFVRDHVIPAGGVLVRRRGDHHIYRLPNGRVIDVPMGGTQSEVSTGIMNKFKQALRYAPPERKP